MYDKLSIPLSIIIAGALVGGGFYLSSKAPGQTTGPIKEAVAQSQKIREINDSDHLLGNPAAHVIIVEYSDTECPYCKQFHSTMRALIENYGSEGGVAWVYRHFPLADLHKKAPHEAEALECANELGGNSKFWEYTNRIYEVTPSNDGLAETELGEIAKQIGLSSKDFNTCLASGKYKSKIDADIADAKNVGGEGTPFSVIVDTKTGDTYPMPGAQSYSTIKNIVDLILQS